MTTAILSGGIVFFAMCIEGITGFGGAVLAIPLLSLLIGLKQSVFLLCCLSLLLSITVVSRYWKKVDRHLYLNILLFAGIGLPIGFAVSELCNERVLKLILGIFITANAIRMFAVKDKQTTNTDPIKLSEKIILFFGGIIHGAFASGGPLLTLVTKSRIHEKSVFRVTMSAVWMTFNSVMLVKNLCLDSSAFCSMIEIVLQSLPFMILGSGLGAILHSKVSGPVFSSMTKFLLLFSGLSSLYTAL